MCGGFTTEKSSRVDVGHTVAKEDDDLEGESEEQAEVEDMMCVRGIVLSESGKADQSQENGLLL